MRSCYPIPGGLRDRAPGGVLALLLVLVFARTSTAAPVVGFREDFSGIATNGWSSGALTSNPGSGGMYGAGDGYLLVSVPGPLPGNLGVTAPTPAYAGDWIAAGVTQVRFWLNDVNATNTLEIHFAVGNALLHNVWQYNVGFVPPPNQWGAFVVDLTAPGNFTRIIGTATAAYDTALMNVDRILIRHDRAPYGQIPDAIVGDFGIDGVLLTNGVASVESSRRTATGQPVRLAPPAPNPSRGAVMLRMDTADAGPVVIQVVDALGRVTRHGELPAGAAGSRAWNWDGMNDRGVAAAPGYYRVRAIGKNGGTSQPLLRLP